MATKEHSTGNAYTHYRSSHPTIPLNEQEAQQQVEASNGGQSPWNRKKRIRANTAAATQANTDSRFQDVLLKLIVACNLALSIVDSIPFQEMVKLLNPGAKSFSRRTITKALKEQYETRKLQIIKLMAQQISSRGLISLTTDTWTSNTGTSFIGVTAHWVDWTFHSYTKALALVQLRKPVHDAVYLADKLFKVTQAFNISHSIFSVTLDNATVNPAMLHHFESLVRPVCASTPISWPFNSKGMVRCAAHILNIVVQRVLTVLNLVKDKGVLPSSGDTAGALTPASEVQTMSKVRKLANIFRNQRLCADALATECDALSEPCIRLPQDMKVRWSSTYHMCERFLIRRAAITNACYKLAQSDPTIRILSLEENQWEMLSELAKVFKVFVNTSTVLQGSTYVTVHLVLLRFYLIRLKLQRFLTEGELPISLLDAITQGLIKLTLYIDKLQSDGLTLAAVILDPCLNKAAFTRAPLQLMSREKQREAVQIVNGLYDRFRPRVVGLAETQASQGKDTGDGCEFDDEGAYLRRHQINQVANEVGAYLTLGSVEYEVDPLNWWRTHAGQFPVLSQVACAVLQVPASSAPSECVFSQGTDLLTWKRNRLSDYVMEVIICLKSWGFVVVEDTYDSESEGEDL